MRNDEQFQKDVAVYIYSNDNEFLGSGFLLKSGLKTFVVTCSHVLAIQDNPTESGDEPIIRLRHIGELVIKTETHDVLATSDQIICPFEKYDAEAIRESRQPDIAAIEVLSKDIVVPEYLIWDGKCAQGTSLFFRGKPDKSSVPINFFQNIAFDNKISTVVFVIETGSYLQLNFNESSAKNNTALSEIRGASGSGIFCYDSGNYYCLGVFKGLFDKDGVYGKGKGVSVTNLSDLLNLKEIQIGSKLEPMFKPTIEWAKINVNAAVKEAGKRFITHNDNVYEDLNFQTNTGKILEHITNTDLSIATERLSNTHIKMSRKIQNALLDFDAIKGIYDKYDYLLKSGNLTWEDIEKENKCKGIIVWFNKKHFDNLRNLLEFKRTATDLSTFTNKFSVKMFNDKSFHTLLSSFDLQSKSANFFLRESAHIKGKVPAEFKIILPLCISITELFTDFVTPIKQFFYENNFQSTFNTDNVISSAFFKHTVIIGEGLSGKTHLLCDFALRDTLKSGLTLLFFGNKFQDSKAPIKQMVDMLDLSKYNLSEDDFLYSLDWWGKKENKLVSICIDAINETDDIYKTVWKTHFISFVEKIKTYSNIKLIISVRDLEIDSVLSDEAQQYITNDMATIEHKGFENISGKVLQQFCTVFGVEAPSFPTLDPIFVNPGLLFLLFDNLRNRGITKIDDNIVHISNIFNDFTEDLERRFVSGNFDADKDDRYVIPTTDIASRTIVNNNFNELLEYREFKKNAQVVHAKILDFLKSEGVFSVKKEPSKSYLHFSYQRFGNYFVALYLLSQCKTFEEIGGSSAIEKLFMNSENHKSLLESLFRLVYEQYKRSLFDLSQFNVSTSDRLKEVEVKALYSSNCYPQGFSDNLSNLRNLDSDKRSELFEMFLRVSYKTKHNNRFDKSLHSVLTQLTMADLDCYWSPFISDSFNEDVFIKFIDSNNVFRLIDWVFQQQNLENFDIESKKLLGLTLSWFLCSSNRELRDLSTKAMVRLLINHARIIVVIIQYHEKTEDLYILERLWAVAYGVTMRSSSFEGLHELCEYAYTSIFCKEIVFPHILIRDYARGIIEYSVFHKIIDNIELSRIRPPYRSVWSEIPTDEDVLNFELPPNSELQNYHSQNAITRSMQVEHKRNGSVNFYGDFGRYVFQSCIQHFDYQKDNIISYDLMNVAIKRVFSLGYDAEKHGKFDSKIHYDGRSSKKVERIGKKYQWIAMFELLAQLSDKFEFKDEIYGDETAQYNGPWQLYIRDIDPSILTHKNKTASDFKVSLQTWCQKHQLSYNKISDEEKLAWLWTDEDLPNFHTYLLAEDNNKADWFIMKTFLKWSEPANNPYHRNIWYRVQAIFIKKSDVNKLSNSIYKQDLRNSVTLSQEIEHSFFLGEYPWHPMFEEYSTMDNKRYEGSEIKIPIIEFSQCGKGLDFSIDKRLQIDLPSPWLIEKLKLHLAPNESVEYRNTNNETIFYNPSIIEGGPSASLISKKHLLALLNSEDLTIGWVIGGEKNVYNYADNRKWPGRQLLGGFYYWDGEQIKGTPWSERE